VKIHLILEPSDVKDMLNQYFNAQGFEVKNLAELCGAFEAVFPQGIDVEAVPAAAPIAPEPPPQDRTEEPVRVEPPAPTPDTPLSVKSKNNPRLGLSDLMDPTTHGSVPSRDELLEETSRELQEILNTSRSLETKSNRRS
jgi:hypothetical protein